MPIYEYVCNGCEHRFEELVRTPSGPHPRCCPHCGAGPVDRVISVFAAHSAPTARSSAPARSAGHACGRCGDPNGPCQSF